VSATVEMETLGQSFFFSPERIPSLLIILD
jgi:hypothetical protein